MLFHTFIDVRLTRLHHPRHNAALFACGSMVLAGYFV
jgi:hypothetical protein